MPPRVLITGAAGFAGSHLVELLAGDPAGGEIIAWQRPGGHPRVDAPRTTWDAVDILDREGVTDAVHRARPSIVYHFAGEPHVGRSWGDTTSTFAVNVRGTHYLLEALRAAGTPARVVIPGSAMVYRPAGDPLTEDHPLVPTSPYGLSKLAQELLGIRASVDPLAVTVGRAFNHIGPRQNPSFAASGFARQIAEIEAGLREPEVAVGDLGARRDTMDVRDTVRAYRAIAERGVPGRVYNIATGHAVAISDMLDILRGRARVPVRVRVDRDRFRPNDVPVLVGHSQRLRDELGWTPAIPLSETLDDLLNYWRHALQRR